MRTTLSLDDALLAEAERLTGLREKSALVREGLQALIQRESARRLAALGGTDARAGGGAATMIVVDTSVWIDHLRESDPDLHRRLEDGTVGVHAAVIGELALGTITDRQGVLDALHGLARSVPATDAEVLALVEDHGLAGSGIGWVDAHLLASTLLTSGATLWTHDRRLRAAAQRMHIAHSD